MKKLKNLINEKYLPEETDNRREFTKDEKRAFVEAVGNFHRYGEMIYRNADVKAMVQEMKEIVDLAEQMTLQETEHWFDNITTSRHMKQLKEAYKVFEKTAGEMSGLQQRLEAAYDDIGSVLSKYYKVNESLKGIDEN